MQCDTAYEAIKFDLADVARLKNYRLIMDKWIETALESG